MKKVKISDYQMLTTVGMGTFGRVRLIKHKQTGKYYVSKILKKSQIIKSKQIDHIQNQIQILSSVSHIFIVNMQGFSQDSRHLYIILQYISGGQLLTYLRNVVRLQSSQSIDLKPQNLLISQDGYLKLVDFTFAKIVQTRTFTLCGTPQYLAPQILLNIGHGRAVDWWTLGILVYQMNAGIDPFTDQDPLIIYQNILKGKIKFPRDMDRQIKSFIKYLLVADPSKRLGMLKNGIQDIKQHRLFSKTDFRQILAKKITIQYKPVIKFPGDTSNFTSYPDSQGQSIIVKELQDPFIDW